MKVIDTRKSSPEQVKQLISAADDLKELDHPNIVKYIGFLQSKELFCFILEYCEGRSLYDQMKETKTSFSDEKTIAKFILQVLKGLEYLHRNSTIHRDIKAQNILTTTSGVAKLADFGIAAKATENRGTIAGTPNWMAPEIIKGNGATTLSDIWSLGCTTIELLTGKPPFFNMPTMSALFKLSDASADELIPPGASPLLEDFLQACLKNDPAFRPSAEKLLQHPWITQIVDPAAPSQAYASGFSSHTIADQDGKLENSSQLSRKYDLSKYQESPEDDLSDIFGQLELSKAWAPLTKPGNRVANKDFSPEEILLDEIEEIDENNTSVIIEKTALSKYAEPEEEAWDEVEGLISERLQMKVPVQNEVTINEFDDQLFESNIKESQHRRKVAEAQQIIDDYIRTLSYSKSVEDWGPCIQKISLFASVQVESRSLLLKYQLRLSEVLERIISQSSEHGREFLLPALRLTLIISEIHPEFLYLMCVGGCLKKLVNLAKQKTHPDEKRLAVQSLHLAAAGNSGALLLLSHGIIEIISDLIASPDPEIYTRACEIVWTILSHTEKGLKSMASRRMQNARIHEAVVNKLNQIVKNRTNESYQLCKKMVMSLKDLFLTEAEIDELGETRRTSSHCFMTMFEIYKHLKEEEQITILKLIEVQSVNAENHNSLLAADAVIKLCQALQNTDVSSHKLPVIIWKCLQSIINLCKFNPEKWEDAVTCPGFISYLTGIATSNRPSENKDRAIEIFLSLSDAPPCALKVLEMDNTLLPFYLLLLKDPLWQIKALTAIDKWATISHLYITDVILSGDGKRRLVSELARTTSNRGGYLIRLHHLLQHTPKLCHEMAREDRIYLTLHKILLEQSSPYAQSALQIIALFLTENYKSTVRRLWIINSSRSRGTIIQLLKKLAENGKAIEKKMSKQILEKVHAGK